MPTPRKSLPPSLTPRVFRRADALRAGATPAQLRGPGVQRLDRDLLLDSAREPSLADTLLAYLSVLPRDQTAVDGVTALQAWGIDVGTSTPYRFVTTASYRSKRRAVRVRRTGTLEPGVKILRPVPALVAARTELSLLDLVVAGDWIVQTKLATLAEVRGALAAATGRNSRKAHRAAELVRERVESPRETRLRLMVVFAGLPEPECNVDLGDELFFIGRVDLYLRRWNVAAEYEGDEHRKNPAVFARDLTRTELLTASGVLMVRVAKSHPARDVVHRVHRAIQSRGYDGPAPDFGQEWRDAFE